MDWSIESVREAALTPADVFRFYVDPATWGTWGHNTRWARADGPVVEGATVDVKAGYGKVYPVLIDRLIPDRLVRCVIRPPGMTVTNTYELEAVERGVRIRHTITVAGPFARVTRLLLFPRLYRRLLDKEITKLVRLVTSRS
jgi:hypothetical protein